MMKAPPALDPRTVDLQYALSYRQRAIVPDQQEHETKLEGSEKKLTNVQKNSTIFFLFFFIVHDFLKGQ